MNLIAVKKNGSTRTSK